MLYKAELCVWFMIGVFEALLMGSPESPWRYAFASFALMLSVGSFYAWKVDLLQRSREMAVGSSGGVKVKNIVVYYFTSADGAVTEIWPTTFEMVRLCASVFGVILTGVVFALVVIRGQISIPVWIYTAAGVTVMTLVTIVVDIIHRAC